ncbi:CopM family metallochaperone [Psychrobacter sp. DAB_AL62B]|uniref:CopM family metallochaperone n=1 Tax=Psychrobacter sp. DAB_AL62B TaxID=1028420 RepID=UPI00238101B8|nr:DUF305 domain-containing protein [Psychrobacter sp. DAB_AL62B]MDE4453901.1 DUF305 domain-containing protein [Psychrobacter sp. DAB_AL62B]
MKNHYKLRFSVLAASVSAALLLSACQPTAEKVDPTTTEDVAPVEATETDTTTAVDPHAGHDMSADAMVADGTPMTPMLKDYTESMTKMHKEMMIGMDYNDPDAAFAQGMLGHHIGAVDMAEIELKYGTDAEMRKLAQEIIDAQQSEIATMKAWLADNPDAKTPTADTKAMQQAYADGMDAMHEEMMAGIADPVPDMAFARGMLPHHVGAVDMAETQLKYGKNPEMRKLAQEIIDAQQPEIEQMQSWIAAQKG